MKHSFALIGIFSGFIAICFSGNVQAQQAVHADSDTLPVYNFQQIEPLFHPDSSNDTTYIFNFWATYCAPCVKELPYFDQIGKEFASQKVKIVLISLDFKSQIKSKVIPFLQKREIQSLVVILSDPDANSWIDKISTSWSGVIPATLVVKGDTSEFFEKSFTYEELKLITTKFLEQ